MTNCYKLTVKSPYYTLEMIFFFTFWSSVELIVDRSPLGVEPITAN